MAVEVLELNLYFCAGNQGRFHILSQDELQHLLDELIEKSPCGSRQLTQLKRIAFEQQIWELRIRESREVHQRWESAQKSLQRLIIENDFNGVMAQLGHPARILGGAVQLDKATQKLAMAELSVTLQQRPEVEVAIGKLALAIHLYFQRYFKDEQAPPKEDPKALEALMAFKRDPLKGAYPQFLEFTALTQYLEALVKTQGVEPFPSWEKNWPPYSGILIFELYRCDLPHALREFLIETSPWEKSHLSYLEQLFELELSKDIAQKILSKMLSLENTLTLEFVDCQLRKNHHGELLHSWLRAHDSATLTQYQSQAVQKNLNVLLGALNNLIGLDQAAFYKALEKEELKPGVFGQIVDSLFSQAPQQQYGIDQQHLRRILDQQENLPKNLIAVLQRTLPRGLEGKSIPAALDFMDRLNDRIAEFREKMELSEGLSLEQKEELSDTETVRYILCAHIHARLLSTKAMDKITEMPLNQLVERLLKLQRFELTTGRNRNITKFLEHLWSQQTQLAKLSLTEA